MTRHGQIQHRAEAPPLRPSDTLALTVSGTVCHEPGTAPSACRHRRRTSITAPANRSHASQKGDAEAYRQLLLSIIPYLRTTANRVHADASAAEDTVQDILLTLHEVRQTYDPSRPFKPWLAGIVRHRVADRLRALGRVSAGEVVLEAEHEAFAAPAGTGDLTLDSRALAAALRALPAGLRRAIELLKLQERSLKEAAEHSGVSVASLKVSVHRGIKALRRLLDPAGG